MNIIFDSIIINLKSSTREEFNTLLMSTLINKKQCNKFAKYIKQNTFKSKVIEISYCKQLNKIIFDIRSLEKIKKFFKKTNYQLINNYLNIKLKHIKYQNLLEETYHKLFKVYKQYLRKNTSYNIKSNENNESNKNNEGGNNKNRKSNATNEIIKVNSRRDPHPTASNEK